MAVVPVMMVLYTNDAVEVRYSDGSLLQLSPCGSSMFHQDPPSDLPKHPLAGVQGVQKWTQFVTSAHKAKVLQAVDFRNRFANRPFLCPTLLAPEDIVSLYARIDQIAWGRTAEESHMEVFEDGSRRTVSLDEYASVVLSAHGQDFTVCYLSHVSPDTVGTSASQQSQHSSSLVHSVSLGSDSATGDFSQHLENTQDKNEESEDRKPAESEPVILDAVSGVSQEAEQAPDGAHKNKAALNRNCNNSTPVHEIPMCEEETVNASGLILSDGTISTPGRTVQQCDLQSSAFSVQHDISSISRVSTPDGLRGMVDCDDTLTLNEDNVSKPPPSSTDVLHSSPLSLANTQSCTGQGNSSKDTTETAGVNKTLNNREETHNSVPKSNRAAQQVVRVVPIVKNEKQSVSGQSGIKTGGRGTVSGQTTNSVFPEKEDSVPQSMKVPALRQARETKSSPSSQQNSLSSRVGVEEAKTGNFSRDKEPHVGQRKDRHNTGSAGAHRWETSSGSRHHYTWVTQHISCDSCPPTWRHPLRLLQQMDPSDSVLVSECNLTVSTNVAKGLQKGDVITDSNKRVWSTLACPVPLTCPFQHLHHWQGAQEQGDGGSADSISEFKQGQLKVLMMEGVVYRFVDVANMKVVEIYPGDGSVLISQGTTASFFSHLMWKDGKLEEKTYSVKMLPPHPPTAPYTVQNLIKRAHRLVTGCMRNSQLSERADLPCWKRAVTQVVEPLSASLLEECTVPAYGRFQAFSNGRVRVVFEDRTTLDMMADFSQRLHDCVKHSSVDEMSMEEKLAAIKLTSSASQPLSSQCRLLLPSGKYVMVEALKPGQYRRYIDAAKEWIQWVQSSPKERHKFYQNKPTPHSARISAEAELKKIECFNYIVDHSALTHTLAHRAPAPASQSLPTMLPSSLGTNIFSASGHPVPAATSAAVCQHPTGHQSVPAHHHSGVGSVEGSAVSCSNANSSLFTSDPRGLDLLQGFSSVREALLRTSQMIKEIDDIVGDSKESGSGH